MLLYLCREVYDKISPGFRGRCTAPLLIDKQTKRPVSNESSSIVRMLGQMHLPGCTGVDLYPQQLQQQIDALNEKVGLAIILLLQLYAGMPGRMVQPASTSGEVEVICSATDGMVNLVSKQSSKQQIDWKPPCKHKHTLLCRCSPWSCPQTCLSKSMCRHPSRQTHQYICLLCHQTERIVTVFTALFGRGHHMYPDCKGTTATAVYPSDTRCLCKAIRTGALGWHCGDDCHCHHC
eukprot:GHUV01019478.1.p1 GENE.GHUV01019478.1~~GHUV01019478.1.p1  ORF type:complete len:235 (+),score=19.67 GHUV01019478.1:892-1596(+)